MQHVRVRTCVTACVPTSKLWLGETLLILHLGNTGSPYSSSYQSIIMNEMITDEFRFKELIFIFLPMPVVIISS